MLQDLHDSEQKVIEVKGKIKRLENTERICRERVKEIEADIVKIGKERSNEVYKTSIAIREESGKVNEELNVDIKLKQQQWADLTEQVGVLDATLRNRIDLKNKIEAKITKLEKIIGGTESLLEKGKVL